MNKITVLSLFFSLSSAFSSSLMAETSSSSYSERIQKMFEQSQTAKLSDGDSDWLCTYEDGGKVRAGSSYGLVSKNGRLFVTSYGGAGMAELKATNNAMIAEDRGVNGTKWISFRAVETSKGRRLLLEESTNYSSWQTQQKSKITGFSPNLYLICMRLHEIFGE